MTTSTVLIRIEYDHKMSVDEAEALFRSIKGSLGATPVAGFHFDCIHNEG